MIIFCQVCQVVASESAASGLSHVSSLVGPVVYDLRGRP